MINVKTTSLYTDGYYYEMDNDNTKITGLVAKSMSVSLNSSVKMIVNTKMSIQIDVVLSDTIYQPDTFKVHFPAVAGFNYSYGIWNITPYNLNPNTTVYDSINKVL